MGHILFVQTQAFAYPGLYYICGALKDSGYQYNVMVSADHLSILEYIKIHRPTVVGFPCMTGMHKTVLQIAVEIKKAFPQCKTLIGGIHPTLYPEIINEQQVDFICRGEGEYPTVELLKALDEGVVDLSTKNISYKKNGTVRHNPMRQLIQPLDSLPFPDYSIYRNTSVIASDTFPMVYMTRGCPFSCTYCHNSNQRKIYRGLGKYVRNFSVDRILDEVSAALTNYSNTTAVMLGSDTLGNDMEFITNLFNGFNRRFDVPYTCLIHPEFVTENLVKLLRDTNCHMIAFGVESGSERIRKDLLNRKYSNKQIIKISKLLNQYGVKFRTYNIVGFPSETREEMLATLKLNQAIKPSFPWASIFTPYPETKLSDFAKEYDYLEKNFTYDNVPVSFFNDTLLRKVDRDFILNLHAFFQLYVLVPWLYPATKVLLSLPHNQIFRVIFKLIYSYVCIKSENRKVFSFLKLAMANRKLFR